jgi:hypothetical protein
MKDKQSSDKIRMTRMEEPQILRKCTKGRAKDKPGFRELLLLSALSHAADYKTYGTGHF